MRLFPKTKLKEQELLEEINDAIGKIEESKRVWLKAKGTGRPWDFLVRNPELLSRMTVRHILLEMAKTLAQLEKNVR